MEQFKAAFFRGLLIAFCSAGASFFTTWATIDDAKKAAITAGATFFASLVIRFGGEGAYDAYRQAQNMVKPGDVGGENGNGDPLPGPVPAG